MTRVLSGLALIVILVGAVWFAPAPAFFAFAQLVLVLAFKEYADLAKAVSLEVPLLPAGAATVLAAVGVSSSTTIEGLVTHASLLDVMLMSAFVALGALALTRWQSGPDALARVSASAFPMLYLGLPVGALVAIRAQHGREALLLLMASVAVSDTAQYYSGRTFGRRPLAPTISPKKTLEGAIGGFIIGGLFLAVAGAWWLPQMDVTLRALLGATLVALGIAGDLFESMLKRSAGVKDSSSLIPGHGGVLDRIDALLFTAPIYYIVLKYV